MSNTEASVDQLPAECCGTCKFIREGYGTYVCAKRAPLGGDWRKRWPQVSKLESCGDWRRPKAEKADED